MSSIMKITPNVKDLTNNFMEFSPSENNHIYRLYHSKAYDCTCLLQRFTYRQITEGNTVPEGRTWKDKEWGKQSAV